MRGLITGAIVLAIIAADVSRAAESPFADDPLVLHGSCSADSHTSEGPANTDLTQQQMRFFCDAATIIEYKNDKNRLLIGFSNYESLHDPIVSFDGELSDADRLEVTSVSKPHTSGEVDEGLCTIFRNGRGISRIFCGATVKTFGRREVEMINFFVH